MKVLAVLICVLLSPVFAQAPGDEDDFCRTGPNTADDHVFPAEVKILLDSYDYFSVSSIWSKLDADGDGITWGNSGGVCEILWTRSCTTSTTQELLNRQDNWIFTQHVSYDAAKEVLFNVTFNFADCRFRPCANEYVTVHINQRSNMDNAGRTTTSNYQPLLSGTDSRLQRPPGSTSQTTTTLRYTRPPSSNGFYLGIRDEGTCGQVGRLIAHYLVCPRRVEGLVTYPETALPPQNSPDVIFDAVCASNADNTSSLQVRASSSGSCTALASGGPSCRCNAGYVLSGGGTTCTACSSGQYRTLSDTSCQQCPGNTNVDMEAAPLCTCVDGFYRTPQEGPEVGCTEPPTASRDLMVLSKTDTTLTISWSRPTITGRSDFFYRVLHTDPNGDLGEFVVANSELRNPSSSVTYRLTGLIPFTSYTVRVTTHNGVSNQDSVNDFLRETDINAMTQEGVPSQTRAIQRLCTVVVWQDPLQPNGRIVGYDLDFRNSAGQTNLVEVPAGSTFYLTRESERESGTDVRVRARTGVGPGDWTLYEGIGCMGDTPDCPPVECPPTTPCADVTTIPASPATCPTCPPCRACPTTPPPEVCTTPPTPVCPTCPPIPTTTECPPPTTPSTPPPTACTCPEATCPTATCPDCPVATCPTSPEPTSSELWFELRGTVYPNNSVVLIDDIGEEDAALLCQTTNQACCRDNREGEFFYPNGTAIPTPSTGYGFSRNRDAQLIRLNRRSSTTSPLGQYRCQLPDSSGQSQSIVITLGSTSTTCPPTNPTCPPLIAPTCPPLITPTCPPVTTPTCPPVITPTCPPTDKTTPPTCPPTSEPVTLTCPPISDTPTPCTCPEMTCPECLCPTMPTSRNELWFELRGTVYPNNSVVLIEDIGEEDGALLCQTTNQACCRDNREGEFFYPNGTAIPTPNTGYGFSRNRDAQLIRLNRRSSTTSPLGQYRCQLPDSSGQSQSIVITLSSTKFTNTTCPYPPTSDTPTPCTGPEMTCPECLCPTMPASRNDNIVVIELIETINAFVGLLSSPAIGNVFQMNIFEVGRKKRQAPIPIEIETQPGKRLILIDKEKLNMLVRGNNYSIMIEGASNSAAPFMFRYTEELESCTMNSEGSSVEVYVLVILGSAVPVTAVLEAIVIWVVFIIWKKKNKKIDVLQKYQPKQHYELQNSEPGEKALGIL